MAVQSRACPNCGASIPIRAKQCAYCETWIDDSSSTQVAEAPLDLSAGEFGVHGWGWLIVALGGASVFYGMGWFYEDTEYWLDDAAIGLWAAALPGWLFLTALGWRAGRGEWLSGIAYATFLFVIHLGVMAFIDRRIQDDHVGIAAMFAGAALAGWLLGRLLHITLRRTWARQAQANEARTS